MIIVTNGIVVFNKTAITDKNGPQTLPPEVEARLVLEGAAEYVHPAPEKSRKGVATPPEDKIDKGEGDNPPDNDPPPEKQKPAPDKPQYNIDMKAAELRELLEECKLTYKVGMSKADMVAALDEYFTDAGDNEPPPVLGAEDPVI